jgi:riboflavin biosynthesis pyrimidine reductase
VHTRSPGLSVMGGPTIVGAAIDAGLVDELRLIV